MLNMLNEDRNTRRSFNNFMQCFNQDLTLQSHYSSNAATVNLDMLGFD